MSTPQKRKAPADFSTVRSNKGKQREKDPAYDIGIKNYIQDASYAGQEFNQLKIVTSDITEKALDDPENFALQLEGRERPRTRGSRAQELGRDAVQVGHLVVV